jgi:hypothetical protein
MEDRKDVEEFDSKMAKELREIDMALDEANSIEAKKINSNLIKKGVDKDKLNPNKNIFNYAVICASVISIGFLIIMLLIIGE